MARVWCPHRTGVGCGYVPGVPGGKRQDWPRSLPCAGSPKKLEAPHVSNARAQGWTWQAIASALGVRRQSVHKKHARRVA